MCVLTIVILLIAVGRRPRVTTPAEDRTIVEAAEGGVALRHAADLKQQLQLAASTTTIRRRLREAGLRSRVAAKKELLTPAHRAARLHFAQEYAEKGLDFWSRVVFSDEKTFRSSDQGRVRVWRRENTR